MSDKVYLGPLRGFVEPNLSDARCMEIVQRERPLFKMRRPFAGTSPTGTITFPPGVTEVEWSREDLWSWSDANHDPGDEDRR